MPLVRVVVITLLALTATRAVEAQRTTGAIIGTVVDSPAPFFPASPSRWRVLRCLASQLP